MDLVDILSQAADLSEDTSLDFDVVADRCNKSFSGDLMGPSPAGTASASAKEAKAKKAGKTQAKKRSWKKPKDKPKRPLSAYNLFFKHEREKIVMATAAAEGFDPEETLKEMRNVVTKEGKRKRYRNRKSHGKIGFAALAKNIAEKWKTLDDAAKSPFEARASKEKERYKAELDKWNEEQKAKKQKIAKSASEADMVQGLDNQAEVRAPQHENAAPPEQPCIPCLPTSSARTPLEQLFSRNSSNFIPSGFVPGLGPLQQKKQQPLSSGDLFEILDRATAVLGTDYVHQPSSQQQGMIVPDSCNSSMDRSHVPTVDTVHNQATAEQPISSKQYIDSFDRSLYGILGSTSHLNPSMKTGLTSSVFMDMLEPTLLNSNSNTDVDLGDLDEDLELINLLSS